MMEQVRHGSLNRKRFLRLKESKRKMTESYSRVQLIPAVHLRYSARETVLTGENTRYALCERLSPTESLG